MRFSKLSVVALFISVISAISQADCVPYDHAINPEVDGASRQVQITGTMDINPMAEGTLKNNTDESVAREATSVLYTLTPRATEILDPAVKGQRICLPAQFTLYITDAPTQNLARVMAVNKVVVTIKATLSSTENSIDIIGNGLLTDIEF